MTDASAATHRWPTAPFDVAVIGTGVIGCAVARRFTLEGARVAVLDKAPDVLDGASKGNSAILHTGFDAPTGSLELACMQRGYDEYLRVRHDLNLPVMETGALVLAWNEEQQDALPGLIRQAHDNGVGDVERMEAAHIREMEPNLSPALLGGFRVPGEFLIDPWSAPHAYLGQALLNGAELRLGCELLGGHFQGSWQLQTSHGPLVADTVINCAGLYGDRVEERLLGHAGFEIRPRKGQFVVFDKSAFPLVRHILLPVPTAVTKGIVVCRTVYGNVLVGPTAEEQDERDVAALVPETLETLRQRGCEIVPGLAEHPVTALYAALRPATQYKEYQITEDSDCHYIGVGGIRSTGLTSSLGTAHYVFERYQRSRGDRHRPIAAPLAYQPPNISECAPRAWEQPGNGGIVCHCERVTRSEIERALQGPLPAHTLAGLKRRTRVTMGRCQGFYCSAALAELTEGRLTPPLAERVEGGAHD